MATKTVKELDSITIYRDGREETLPVKPWHEITFGRELWNDKASDLTNIEVAYRIAFIVDGKPGLLDGVDETAAFDAWAKTLDRRPKQNFRTSEIDVDEDESAEAVPFDDDIPPTSSESQP